MSRHRGVRSMNYSDEYEGYDDVYGHSVEDDYCVSPSAEQFLFDRSKQQNIASFITEPDIVEDNEDIDDPLVSPDHKKFDLSELETSKLISCVESIRNIIGDTLPESTLKETIIKSGFDTEVALNTILKESSPQEESTVNEEHIETHTGATSNEPDNFTFAIPKFSFKKQQSRNDESITHASSPNQFGSLKSLTNNSSSAISFSCLADMIADHNKSRSSLLPNASKSNAEVQSFCSLSDLTAHHLQISNNIVNNTDSQVNTTSPHSSFVIPKLLTNKTKNKANLDTKSSKLFKLQDGDRETTSKNVKTEEIDNSDNPFLNNSVDNTLYKYNLNANKHSDVESQNNFVDIRAPSPDNWIIDLSTALKDVENLNTNESVKVNCTPMTNFYDNSELDKYLSNTESVSQYSALICTDIKCILNLSNLKDVKIAHTKKTASSFGRTLCKVWTHKKPAIKRQKEQYKTINRFDFSTPYRRA